MRRQFIVAAALAASVASAQMPTAAPAAPPTTANQSLWVHALVGGALNNAIGFSRQVPNLDACIREAGNLRNLSPPLKGEVDAICTTADAQLIARVYCRSTDNPQAGAQRCFVQRFEPK